MASPIARLRTLDPRVIDRTLAAAFVVGGAVEMTFFAEDATDYVVGAAVSLSFGTLAVRRARPLIPSVVIPAAQLTSAFFAPYVINVLTAGFLAVMVAFYSLGRYRGRVAVPVIGLALAAFLVASIIGDEFDWGELFWLAVVGAGPFLIGRAMRNRTRLQAELRARTEEIERDRETRAARVVEDERARIATELQAVIANGVSAMVVQAEIVPRAIEGGDTGVAARTLAAIEETGRNTLAETRRLLGVLRPVAGDVGSLLPQPTLASLEGLAERVRGEGLAVELRYEGDPVELAPGADLAAYRAVQDALETAAGAGASTASVSVSFADGELELDVTDDRAEDPAGDALAPIRERLGLYGGRVRESRSGGGYTIQARMPLNGAGS